MYRTPLELDLRRMRSLERFDPSTLDEGEHEVRLPMLRSRQDRVLAALMVVLGVGGLASQAVAALPVSIVVTAGGIGSFFVTRVLTIHRFAEDA